MSSAADKSKALEGMPRWNLERHFLYKSPFDPKLDETMADLEGKCKAFHESFNGKLDKTDTALGDALKAYEQIRLQSDTLESYVYLAFATQQDNAELNKRQSFLSSKQSKISGDYLTFFDIEIAKIEDDRLKAIQSADPRLAKFSAYIEEARRSRPYYLSPEVERALTVRHPWAGREVTVEFFDQQMAKAKFEYPGEEKELNLEQLLSKMSSRDGKVRRTTLNTLNSGLKSNMIDRFATLSMNVVTGAWHIEQLERKYKTVRSQRNLRNNVPDDVVECLSKSVREVGVPMAKRFYRLKKSILKTTSGLETFTWADRNAPLDLGKEEDLVPWAEACTLVEAGFRKFSPTMAKMFTDMVEEERLDGPAVNGKRGGAFCHGVVPGIGPFQLHNYMGNKRDVATLAHESGHGCHDILAYEQGVLQYHPPLTLAETASIFGEMVVFRDLLEKTKSKQERLSMLLMKIDDIVNSVVRQCSFDRFEELAHTARANGQLSEEDLSKFWMQATKEYYGEEGEVFDKYEDMDLLWAYVPHFHHVPFYVYAYAFADLVVGSLYHTYMKTPEGFEGKLLDLLRAGGSKDFVTALKPLGLDPSKEEFWADSINAHLGPLVDEAEAIAKELKYVQ